VKGWLSFGLVLGLSFLKMVWGLWSLWTEAGAVDNSFIVIHGEPAGA
jgi:hypothetical protein